MYEQAHRKISALAHLRIHHVTVYLRSVQSLDIVYLFLYNNQINARALIGQSAMGYCAGKPMEKSRVFWIII